MGESTRRGALLEVGLVAQIGRTAWGERTQERAQRLRPMKNGGASGTAWHSIVYDHELDRLYMYIGFAA